MAIKFSNFDLVKYLVEDEEFQPSNINMEDIHNEYPLIKAIHSNEFKIFNYLLDHSSSHEINNNNNNNLLSIAIDRDQYDIVRCLLNHNIDINKMDAYHCYPLITAIYKNRINIVKTMVRYGIQKHMDLNYLDINGNPPITIAYRHDYLELFKFLSKFLDINKKDTSGNTVLFYVVYNNDFTNLKYLINLGADMNIKNNSNNTVIDILLTKKSKEMLIYLIQNNYKIEMNAKTITGDSILFSIIKSTIYTEQEKLEIVPLLIEKGSDVNQENNDAANTTPLYYAIQIQSLSLIEILVQHGANVNYFIQSKNQSLLMYAVEIGNLNIINYLIDCHANVKTNHGPSAWQIALRKGQTEVLKCLAKRNIEDLTGDQLYETISENKLDQLKLLISCGLNPDLKNEKGNTLLATAIICKQIDIINYLISLRVNIFSINNEGQSILKLATDNLQGNSTTNNTSVFGNTRKKSVLRNNNTGVNFTSNSNSNNNTNYLTIYLKIKNLCMFS